MKTKFKLLCGAVALSVAGQASATSDWLLTTGTVSGTNVVSSVTVTSEAWANTGPLTTPTNLAAGDLAKQAAPTYFTKYSGYNGGLGGLGINNMDGCTPVFPATTCAGDVGDMPSSAPEHAIDNQQRYEMVLLTFSQSVKLTNAKFGWIGTDSDYTVMAYTGGTLPPSALGTGKSWGDVGAVGSGWASVGNYSDATLNTNNVINNNSDPNKVAYSSYWLIGAYNPLANPNGGSVTTPTSGSGADYLKLYSVTGCVTGTTNCTPPSKVPEPGSLVLVGFALMGMMGLRKRWQA